MFYVGMFVGSLLPTLLVSRILLLILKKWDGGWKKLVFAHVISLLLSGLLAGMGMADGGAFVPIKAIGIYALPQAIWLGMDLFLLKRKQSKLSAP